MEYLHLFHGIPPVWNEKSKILILGSFPSVKSRESGFFYGHPQNRFWSVLAKLYSLPVPKSIDEKKSFLLDNGIALWDVVGECDIIGSSDSSIKNVLPNDIGYILRLSQIKRIFANGAAAKNLYDKYIYSKLGEEAIRLPSTSPANAAWTYEKLCEAWSIITE